MNNVNHNNEPIRTLDYVSLLSAFIGVLNYSENLKQTSNDDLLHEFKKQNKEYLNEILERLENIEGRLK